MYITSRKNDIGNLNILKVLIGMKSADCNCLDIKRHTIFKDHHQGLERHKTIIIENYFVQGARMITMSQDFAYKTFKI